MSAPEIGDLLPDSHIHPVTPGSVTRIVIPCAMVAAMIVASVGICYWSYLSHRDEALVLADDLIDGIGAHIRSEVEGYLAPVGRLARLSTDVLGAEALSAQHEAFTRPFAFGVLTGNEQITIASFADPDGNFLMYVRQDSGAIDTRRIDRSGAQIVTSWVRRNASGEVTERQVVDNDGYDPRVRPWYRGALQAAGIHWTDVYAFFTSKQPGVTVSIPVIDASGETRAVYGLDITLADLSEFLSKLEIGATGTALIFNESGRLVAFPDMDRMMLRNGESLRTADINELGDPVLSRALNRFRIEGHGRRVLNVDGERYLNAVNSLATVVGRDWSVMIVVPETDFTGKVNDDFKAQLLVSMFVVALAALLASRVVKQGLAAQRHGRELALRETLIGRRSEALGQLASSVASLESGDPAAMSTFTEALAHALNVHRVSVWRWENGASQLRCEDAFDSRSGGHVDSTHLKRSAMPALADAMDAPLAILDVDVDPRTRDADRAYFKRLDVTSMLSVPVVVGDVPVAVIWVGDRACTEEWARDALHFLVGLAQLLAPRYADDVESEIAARTASAISSGGSETQGPSVTDHEALRTASLASQRSQALRERAGAGAHTDVFARVSVLALMLDDPGLWGRRSGADAGRSLLDELVRLLQEKARELGIDYLKIMGTNVVCAAGFDAGEDDDGLDGARAIAALALCLESECGQLLTAAGGDLSFRIGLDVGPALGAAVGGTEWVYNLWGDAVTGAECMALSAASGTTQASDTCYRLLRDEHLFSARGRYFVPEIGETATYLLLGHT